MDYKAKIIDSLNTLKEKAPPEIQNQYDSLIAQAKRSHDQRELFAMWQTLREVLFEGNAPFTVDTPKGKVEVKNLKEAEKLAE